VIEDEIAKGFQVIRNVSYCVEIRCQEKTGEEWET
jgi:hypothetical protein